MRKICLILCVAACAFASCTKGVEGTSGSQMKLSPVVEVNSATKAVITGTTFPTSRSMVVSADLMANTGGSGNYFTGVTFTYDGGSSVWVPATTYYWPLNGGLEMLAYSQGSVSVTPTWTNATNIRLVSTDFTADDVLLGGLTDAKPATKSIAFKHALSQVKFQGKASVGSVVKIKGITINAYKGATINGAKSGGSSNVTITTSTLTGQANVSSFSGNQALTTSYADVGTNGSPILIPAQTPASVTVTYTITNNSVESGTMTVTKSLSTAMVSGSAYTVQLNFTLTGLTVTATLTDWASGGNVPVSI